ncbi:aminotransferase class V-fold PLP-dependent enzyme [Rhodoblastus acidophilus]|uniref:Cysteine desulfurase n=1 Tax=Rhodoblastus acidophilus TaxID=1074 RepID=A0A6N8DP90_RHOAC|nr:cysteine desulfurase family protein [Rhodoblastus acidophilus]MCW2275250.1 cysteine desulfurase [Rhodoblastus acidophilus]MTV32217.1 aminotransferase class V-fold PLP-dependent enzyme [Rhodoblastus acidophilus]
MARLYFDHNATSPLRPAAREALIAALDAGNASSVHAEGRSARAKIENARGKIARHFGVRPELVVFTSGATEAANMVLRPALAGLACDRLLLGGGEHPCVVSGHGFAEAVRVALDGEGRLDLADLRAKLTGPGVPMLALQAANNETGVIQPVAEAAAFVHEAGGVVVCDAVQALGRVDCGFAATGADVLFVSSHKIGGPKGVGAAIFARRAVTPAEKLLRGGGQERGFRGGTENVAAIAGFAAAFSEVLAQGAAEMARLGALRDRIEADVLALAPEAVVFGAGAPRLQNTLAFALPGFSAETMVAALDVEGVALSSGSACSSGKVSASAVLGAMGVAPEVARCALRISLGWPNSEQEGVAFPDILAKVRQRMSQRR